MDQNTNALPVVAWGRLASEHSPPRLPETTPCGLWLLLPLRRRCLHLGYELLRLRLSAACGIAARSCRRCIRMRRLLIIIIAHSQVDARSGSGGVYHPAECAELAAVSKGLLLLVVVSLQAQKYTATSKCFRRVQTGTRPSQPKDSRSATVHATVVSCRRAQHGSLPTACAEVIARG
jgi:hypothetical protein